jgi:hypothetical protein
MEIGIEPTCGMALILVTFQLLSRTPVASGTAMPQRVPSRLLNLQAMRCSQMSKYSVFRPLAWSSSSRSGHDPFVPSPNTPELFTTLSKGIYCVGEQF